MSASNELAGHETCGARGQLVLSSAATTMAPNADRATAATILIVEDDGVMSRTLSKAFRAYGYQVRVAATAADARAVLAKVQPDVIILDLMLPDADGLSLTTSFRALTSAPIIICSARHGQLDRVLGLKLGAADFVAKPFELAELEARVAAVLRAARGSDASKVSQFRGTKHGMGRE